MPPGQNYKTVGSKIYYFDKLIGTHKTNSVMVMFIIHIVHITCLGTNDAWHTYDVIGVYKGMPLSRSRTLCGILFNLLTYDVIRVHKILHGAAQI